MKSLALSLFVLACAAPSYAASFDAKAVWQQGNQLIDKAVSQKKMDYILNPNVCANPETGEIVLIYSDDFRMAKKAYMILPEGIKAIDRGLLNIQAKGAASAVDANLAQFPIELPAGRIPLTCVQSTSVLEAPSQN